MLVLTFQVGREPVALDIRRVREVIPRVRLQPLTGAPDWLAGVFVYRGRVIPVVDLHQLTGNGECPLHLSSRIILVPVSSDGTGDHLLGLLASQVADLREVSSVSLGTAGVAGDGRVNLGPVIADDRGVLRLLDPEKMFAPAAWQQVVAAAGTRA